MDNNTNNTIMDDAERSIEYYKNRILSALEEYRTVNNIDDLHKISKTRWKAALSYIYETVFKPEGKTRQKSALPYDNADILNGIADIYISLCNEYEKDISLYGYSILTGISYEAIYGWSRGIKDTIYFDRVNNITIEGIAIQGYRIQHSEADIIELPKTAFKDITKKLTAGRQESLRSLSLDGSIPALALGKIEYGWIEGGLQQKQAELIEQSRAAADLLQEYKRGMIEGKTDNNI